MVFSVLKHLVLKRKYVPLFQDDFVLLLLREGGGLFYIAYLYSRYKFHVHLITTYILSLITKRSIGVCMCTTVESGF